MSNLTSEQQLAKLDQWIEIGAMSGSKKESVICTVCGHILNSHRDIGGSKFVMDEECNEGVCNWIPHVISW